MLALDLGRTMALTSSQVSVVIPSFNCGPYIAEAIDSVLAQDFDDFELLLVDDGSSDASSEMAKGYADLQPERVRVLEHPNHENRGMSATRNLGLRHARGEYVAFIDADDRWRSSKLREQVALLDAHPEVDAGPRGLEHASLHLRCPSRWQLSL